MKHAIPCIAACACLVSCGPRQRPAAPPPPARDESRSAPEPPAPAPTPPGPAPTPDAGPREAFAHIRIDRDRRTVEFDGTVPINAHDPQTPVVFLELVACTRDTKEHEALVVTDARPSEVHAALLLLGLEPGRPGAFEFDGRQVRSIPPNGPGLEVTIAYRGPDGREIEAPAQDWVVIAGTREKFRPRGPGPAWVFAGSRFVVRQGREWYDADGAGTLIGLTTFGGETIAWADTLSPESAVQEPEWIADASVVPAYNTPVVVRIRPAR